MSSSNHHFEFWVMAAFLVVILSCFLTHIYNVNKLNNGTHYTNGKNILSNCYADIHARSGESWVKRDILIGDSEIPCNLTGTVYDITVTNRDISKITDWRLKINITEDCYINQDWCGEVEIHQFSKNEEGQKVEVSQRLALKSDMSSKLSQIYLKYYMVGQDLLIPLKEGDYIIYYPDADSAEVPIESASRKEPSSITFGVIFYYLNSFSPVNYQLIYKCTKGYFKGVAPNIYIIMAIFWLIICFSEIVSFISVMNTKKEMQQKISGLSVMSEIYDHIFAIDLKTKTVSVVPGVKEVAFQIDKDKDIFEQLISGADENYTNLLKEFLDLQTLQERLSEHSSVICDYKNKTYGWCSIRFHILEKNENGIITKVLCTIRIIEEERKNMEMVSANLENTVKESRAKSEALEKLTQTVTDKLVEIIITNSQLINDNQQENLRQPIKKVNTESNFLLAITAASQDYFRLKDSNYKDNRFIEVKYNSKDLINQLSDLIQSKITGKQIDFKIDTSANINFNVTGDYLRFKAILLWILYDMAEGMNEGTLKLGAFAKEYEDSVEFMYTLTQEGNCKGIDVLKSDIEVCNGILKLYGTQLKVVSVENKRNDVYFSVKQKLDK